MMKEDLRRETYRTAVGGDRGADRRVACRGGGREPARVAVGAGEAGGAVDHAARCGGRVRRVVRRARYERRPAHQRGLRNYESRLRNGFRPRTVQTLEGELEIEIPQIREAAEPFVSKPFSVQHEVLCSEPLRAMV